MDQIKEWDPNLRTGPPKLRFGKQTSKIKVLRPKIKDRSSKTKVWDLKLRTGVFKIKVWDLNFRPGAPKFKFGTQI